MGTELKRKFLNENWKNEIFTKHEIFEQKISKATGRGVVSVTIKPPRGSSRNPWLVSMRCNDSILKLTSVYEDLVGDTGSKPPTFLSCAGTQLDPKSRLCEVRWSRWPPCLASSQ